MIRWSILAFCVALAGCTALGPHAPSVPVTGITANNGGGERSLRNQPNFGVTTRVGP